MIIELNHLRCFVAVAEELHFGRAAARLFITQPPLSRQIQLLEQALDVVLFERNSRSVKLTAAGRAYYEDAVRILRLSTQAADSARRVARGDAGQVTMGFTAVSGYHLVPGFITAVREELPGIRVVLKEMVSLLQVKALESREIDLGVMRAQFFMHGIEFQRIAREPLQLAIPAQHPLATRRTIAARDLDALPFVMYSHDGGKYFHDLIAGLFAASGVQADYVQFIDQTHTIVALVRAGIGVAIVPASARELCFEEVVFRPLWTQDAHADIDLAWSEEQTNPAAENVRRFAIEHFARIEKRALTKR
ncbi:LysR family transcriptional regulator [Caballeronia novacaledonica]|uniref:LysR family transcriptional regulator n=1 Tax=Caballeronia novacaledonica TaxID=1544861 RepID=A0A2U3I1P1_9BURK|nr:LysR family transcriptional regulator [Caballeronia novacaledonica]SPB14012.1 LysR family transcriptional regulator [Caballeronia novacaledonica]